MAFNDERTAAVLCCTHFRPSLQLWGASTVDPLVVLLAAAIYMSLCGGFGAYVATEKSRAGIEGFCFGLFLGPVGVVAVACLPQGPDRSIPPRPASKLASDPVDDQDEQDKVRQYPKRSPRSGPNDPSPRIDPWQGL
jgi:hypothetical protein